MKHARSGAQATSSLCQKRRSRMIIPQASQEMVPRSWFGHGRSNIGVAYRQIAANFHAIEVRKEQRNGFQRCVTEYEAYQAEAQRHPHTPPARGARLEGHRLDHYRSGVSFGLPNLKCSSMAATWQEWILLVVVGRCWLYRPESRITDVTISTVLAANRCDCVPTATAQVSNQYVYHLRLQPHPSILATSLPRHRDDPQGRCSSQSGQTSLW